MQVTHLYMHLQGKLLIYTQACNEHFKFAFHRVSVFELQKCLYISYIFKKASLELNCNREIYVTYVIQQWDGKLRNGHFFRISAHISD